MRTGKSNRWRLPISPASRYAIEHRDDRPGGHLAVKRPRWRERFDTPASAVGAGPIERVSIMDDSTSVCTAAPPVTIEKLVSFGRATLETVSAFYNLHAVEDGVDEFGLDLRCEADKAICRLDAAYTEATRLLTLPIRRLLHAARNHETVALGGEEHHSWSEAALSRPGSLLYFIGMLEDLGGSNRTDEWLRILRKRKSEWLPREVQQFDDPLDVSHRNLRVKIEAELNKSLAILGHGFGEAGHRFVATSEVRIIADKAILVGATGAAIPAVDATPDRSQSIAPGFGLRALGVTHLEPNGDIVKTGYGLRLGPPPKPQAPLPAATLIAFGVKPAESTMPTELVSPAGSVDATANHRRCSGRNHYWAKKHNEGKSYGEIRDAWNLLTEGERKTIAPLAFKRISNAKKGWSVVQKGIKQALDEQREK